MVTLLLTLVVITSSVMSVADVNQLVRRNEDDQVELVRRTPGWGKRQRLHDRLVQFTDKRRGWGKRDSPDNDCAYWQSILLYIKVRHVDSISPFHSVTTLIDEAVSLLSLLATQTGAKYSDCSVSLSV